LKRTGRRILKILGWSVVSIIVLLILVVVLIQVPAVQNFAKNKAVAFLQKKIGTPVKIDHLSIEFPKKVVLEGVYFADKKGDTLLAGRKLAVDISMFALLNQKVEVNDVTLEGIRANIYRLGADTAYNFQYIVDAFVTPPDTTKKKDTTSAGFAIDVKHVRLSKILATFKDDQTGMDTYLYLGDFETNIKRFDLDSMVFNIPKIRLEHVVARAYQHKPMAKPKSEAEVKANNTGPINLGLTVGNLTVRDIDADYGNDISALKAQVRLGELIAEPKTIDLKTMNIALSNLALNNTNAVIAMGATQQAKIVEDQVEKTADAQAENPWKIQLEKVAFANNNFKFDNNNTPRTPRGMDYGHLDIKGLTLDAANLTVTPTAYSGDINQLALSEQSGFVLKRLHASFFYNDRGAYLKDLLLETDKTILRNEIGVAWQSLATLPNQLGEMMIKANLNNCSLGFKDILTFAPTLASAPPFKGNENAVFRLNTNIKGYLKDLEIPNLELSGMSNTGLKISGRIKGLPDGAKATYNLNIATLRTSQSDLNRLLPKGTLPPAIRIPETIMAKGFFVGSMNAFNTKLDVATSRGTASVAGVMRGMGQSYSMTVGTGNLDLGYLLKQEQNLGRVTLQLAANGSGFDPNKMVATVKGKVIAAEAKGYNYRNLNLDAKVNRGNISAIANMRDPNLNFDLDATAFMKGQYPAVKMDLQLDSVNLQALKLYKDELKIHGHINADLPSTNPDALEGSIRINDLIVANNGQRYAAYDTIAIDAFAAEGGGRTLSLKSEAATMTLNGEYKLTEMAPAVQSTINRYYNLPGYEPVPYTPQTWTLNLAVHPSPMLYAFVPAMKGSDSITAAINFNSAANDLNLTANAPKIMFNDNVLDSLTVRAATTDALNYSVSLNSVGNAKFLLNKTSLSGNVANNQLTTNLDVKDPKDVSRYQLSAVLNQVPNDGIRVSLQQGLRLNYDTWNIPGENYIQYDKSGLVINNFMIENNGQSISANSTAPVASAPIDVRFTNFRINTITEIASQDSTLADGLINGTAQLRNPTKDLIFTSDLNIADISFKRDTIGTLTMKVNNETAQTLAADVQLLGNGNDVRIDGRYFIATKALDMNLNLANLNLSTIKPFSAGQITEASGSLKGQMAVNGTVDKPSVNGAIRFEQAFITPTLLGERFALTNEDVAVNATGIHFNSFDIVDSAQNKATINGAILTNDFKTIGFNLNVTADNFQASRSTRKPGTGQPFYGSLNVTTNTKVRGTLTLPVINSYLRVNRGTDFSYVLPTADPEVQSRTGVVEFFDADNRTNTTIFATNNDSLNNSGRKGIDLSATLETDTAARFNLVIDERNNDALHIRGNAALQAAMDPSGKVSLTGTYTISEGSYLLTLSFLRRQFNVMPGSTITFDGEPTSARVDITALYEARTAPIDLMGHQLGGQSAAEINQYKQRIPFIVHLRMRGELLKPEISFDIVLPEREQSRWKDVDQKLAQVRSDESELNKQVFALLLLGRFVDENPLESNGTSSTAESFARQSASRILTDQLNRLAGNLIPGVDLNFGLNSGEDYSTGNGEQRTDLTVGISKRLLNDRLTVNVGSSVQVEGPKSNQASSNIGGDISLEYQLSKDGRYRLRAYRRNDYQGIAVGQVVESGAGFIFTLDYDNFNEFFRRSKKSDQSKNK
jgi:hypothetical protein